MAAGLPQVAGSVAGSTPSGGICTVASSLLSWATTSGVMSKAGTFRTTFRMMQHHVDAVRFGDTLHDDAQRALDLAERHLAGFLDDAVTVLQGRAGPWSPGRAAHARAHGPGPESVSVHRSGNCCSSSRQVACAFSTSARSFSRRAPITRWMICAALDCCITSGTPSTASTRGGGGAAFGSGPRVGTGGFGRFGAGPCGCSWSSACGSGSGSCGRLHRHGTRRTRMRRRRGMRRRRRGRRRHEPAGIGLRKRKLRQDRDAECAHKNA